MVKHEFCLLTKKFVEMSHKQCFCHEQCFKWHGYNIVSKFYIDVRWSVGIANGHSATSDSESLGYIIMETSCLMIVAAV